MRTTVRALRFACLTVLASGSVATSIAQTLTDISPRSARLDVLQEFEATGTGLTNVSIEGCAPDPGFAPQRSPGKLVFRCTPRTPGPMPVGAPALTEMRVTVSHPVRVGDPVRRGLPSVKGVSLFNGNYFHEVADLQLPAKGLPFVLSRSYNSYYFALESAHGAVDNYRPWRFNWDRRIAYVQGSDSRLYIERPDGSGANFFRHTDGQWYPIDQGNFDRLVFGAPGAGQVSLYTRAGTIEVYNVPAINQPGRLQQISDHHGHAFTLSYGANGKVASIKDPAGLQYRFAYDNGARLISVTDIGNRVVSYSWECQPSPCNGAAVQERLKSVTDVRGQITSYVYSDFPAQGQQGPRRMLTAVVDPRGNQAVQLSYVPDVYGNWGVSALSNALQEAWRFAYCAEQAGGACGEVVRAERFKTSVTSPIGSVRQVYFDAAGRSTESLDEAGRASRAQARPVDELSALTYKLAALPLQVQSPLGVLEGYQTRYAYTPDQQGNLAQVTDAENGVRQTQWVGNPDRALHCPAVQITPAGVRTEVQRGATCLAERITQVGGGVSTISYLATDPGLVETVTDARGKTTRFSYDAMGNVVLRAGPSGEKQIDTYNRFGFLTSRNNALNYLSRYTYDNGGLLLTESNPALRVTRYSYDENGNLLSKQEPNGRLTLHVYDAANRRIRTTVRAGALIQRTSFSYDALGRLVRSVNANNHADSVAYDVSGNVQLRANALALETRYEYDADNRLVLVTDPDGRQTRTTYDRLGRVRSVSTAAGTQSYDYDGDGRVLRYTDARGQLTQYSYDAAGRLVAVVDARGGQTSASYDLAGNVASITDPNGNTSRFEYDGGNRRIQRIDALGQIWRTEYDLVGRVISSTAPGGLLTRYRYDFLDQLLLTTLPGGQTVAYSYDDAGNRTSMTDATGTTRYEYDALRRLSKITDAYGQVLRYAYDTLGNRTAITYPHGKTVSYEFDAAERLVAVTDWQGKNYRYTLNGSGQVLALVQGNGSRSNKMYDRAGRLVSQISLQPNGGTISSHEHTLDGNGNPVSSAVQLPMLPSFAAANQTLSYDASNRLLNVNGLPVVHDDAGRMTGIGSESFAFDGRDLLTSYSWPAVPKADYVYNGSGHRVQSTVAGNTTRYVVDPNTDLAQALAETDAQGQLLRSYVYGYGLLAQISAAEVPRYYHFDPQGNTLALSDATGAVTDRYAYSPYGETSASGTSINPFRFVGQYGVMDDLNGLHYMRARYYRADLGRFMGLDRVEEGLGTPQALNRYAYGQGNPIVGLDPSGLYPQSLDELDALATSSLRNAANLANQLSLQQEIWRRRQQAQAQRDAMAAPIQARLTAAEGVQVSVMRDGKLVQTVKAGDALTLLNGDMLSVATPRAMWDKVTGGLGIDWANDYHRYAVLEFQDHSQLQLSSYSGCPAFGFGINASLTGRSTAGTLSLGSGERDGGSGVAQVWNPSLQHCAPRQDEPGRGLATGARG